MGGATARIFTLISTPIPLLHPHRRSSLLLLRRLSSLPSPLFLSLSPSPSLPPPKCSPHFRTQPHPYPRNDPNVFPETHAPWPEWSSFVDRVSRSGYCNRPHIVNDFATSLQSGQGFLSAAHGCLAFAMDHPTLLWSLPREDIKVVVENGSPFLFKHGSSVTERMKCFLGGELNHVPESDQPSTVDLMKFLLSYVHMAVVSSGSTPVCSRVGSSVRTLFSELAKAGGISAESVESVASVQKPSSEKYGQAPRSSGKNIEMKRGDWVCPGCSFMNFAKNRKCLQCEEPRPMKFLTGGEWECPQCDFFNFSRNVACLRCDCKKPEVKTLQSPSTVSGLGANISFDNRNGEVKAAGFVGQQQQWFTKITQLENLSDMGGSLPDEGFPETMSAGDKKFVASTRNLGIGVSPNDNNLQTSDCEGSDTVNISQSLDELLAQNSFIHDKSNEAGEFGINHRDASPFATSSSTSPQYGHSSEVSSTNDNTSASVNEHESIEKPASQMGDRESEQAEKSERWFKKAAELQDVKDLPSAISDEDFPEIMPMRKGENRFVVSKKKDRSLTSPMYKRRAAMEQTGNSNYVPFVPFPPGYFAKDKPQDGSDSTDTTSLPQASVGAMPNRSDILPNASQQTGGRSTFSGVAGERKKNRATNPYETSNTADQTSRSFDSQFSNASGGYSKPESTSGSDFDTTSQASENTSVMDSWRGRSLEGSAVKEPDPLDMSEEAKAERWFRRVAQIKDISELSQIPDEDFPSIMPMRKGVNRFVVSKRKTPLERRLTSSQYRRNLPVTTESDSVKNETDTS